MDRRARTSAGYSGTPLVRKLGIKVGHLVAVLDAPKGIAQVLGTLPEQVTLRADLPSRAEPDVIIWFVSRRASFARRLIRIRRRMAPASSLWIAWPKKSSGVVTDMTENEIRGIVLPTGLVDNKVCAIDETWSGLRFVIRLEHRR